GEVNLRVAVGVGVVLFEGQVALVVGPPIRRIVRPWDYLSLLGLVAGISFGLLWLGARAGLPDRDCTIRTQAGLPVGNCPAGKFPFEGAIRSSRSSIRRRTFL